MSILSDIGKFAILVNLQIAFFFSKKPQNGKIMETGDVSRALYFNHLFIRLLNLKQASGRFSI